MKGGSNVYGPKVANFLLSAGQIDFTIYGNIFRSTTSSKRGENINPSRQWRNRRIRGALILKKKRSAQDSGGKLLATVLVGDLILDQSTAFSPRNAMNYSELR